MRRRTLASAMAVLSTGALAQDFATPEQARTYIVATLPTATAASPPYFTKRDGARTQWFTDEVIFATDADGIVAMREHMVMTKDGKTAEARHEVRFALRDMNVGPYLEVNDVTPSGAAATGIAFACRTRGCVKTLWGGVASQTDSTDVYVQDLGVRDRLVAAFRRLQAP